MTQIVTTRRQRRRYTFVTRRSLSVRMRKENVGIRENEKRKNVDDDDGLDGEQLLRRAGHQGESIM